jgi:hypothetical protein
MATETANKQYKYSVKYHNKTLDQWIQIVHKKNAIINKWKVTPLKPGAFGYDNLALSIATVFDNIPDIKEYNKEKSDIIETMADLIHKGWIINYLYWRDNKPWQSKEYTKPAQPLGDERRNKCASLDFTKLPEEEKLKDINIANFLYEELH